MEGEHRPVAGDGDGQRVTREHAGNIGAEPLAARSVRLGGVGGEELAEHDAAGSHRRDVVVERAGVRDRAGAARIELGHQLGAAAERAEREAAADVLAVRAQAGLCAEERRKPRPAMAGGHHLVGDADRAGGTGDGKQPARNPGSAGIQPPEPSIGSTSTAARSSW